MWRAAVARVARSTLATAARRAADNVWRKAQLFSLGALHLLFSSDGSGSHHARLRAASSTYASDTSSNGVGRQGPDSTRTSSSATALHADCRSQCSASSSTADSTRRRRRIIFVRHAESEWNVVFNRGTWWLAVARLVRAVAREWLLLPTPDSLFLDSPLSARGVRQADALFDHVCDQSGPAEIPHATPPLHWLRYLGCALPNSVVVSSNLRRGIDTARIASAARLELPGERIHVLSCLQEIGRNLDTLALSDAHSVPPPALLMSVRPSSAFHEKRDDELLNLAESHGNKAVLGSGRHRLRAFAKWCFQAQQRADVVVAYGHSHWFRAFCREFLPPHVAHDARNSKLANCGVVTFQLEQEEPAQCGGRTQFVIRPESFEYVR